MSLHFILEIEEGDVSSLFRLAEGIGGFTRDHAWFEASGTNWYIEDAKGDPFVGAEDPSLTWTVGARCYAFMRPSTYDDGWRDVERFVRLLAEHFSQRFVVSFEYSSIYAVRDERGLRFLKPGLATCVCLGEIARVLRTATVGKVFAVPDVSDQAGCVGRYSRAVSDTWT